MPWQWVDPAVAVEHNGVKVYHVYRGDGTSGGRMDYWYTVTSYECHEDQIGDTFSMFDVRDLASALGLRLNDSIEGHRAVIRVGIARGLLKQDEVPVFTLEGR